MSTITFITDVCSGVSLYHVALIVLLRCFAIARPMTFKEWHKRFGKISIYVTWIFNVAIVLIPTVICTKGFTTYDSMFFDDDYLKLYGGAWHAVQHITWRNAKMRLTVVCHDVFCFGCLATVAFPFCALCSHKTSSSGPPAALRLSHPVKRRRRRRPPAGRPPSS